MGLDSLIPDMNYFTWVCFYVIATENYLHYCSDQKRSKSRSLKSN